jgi:predicted site-specific integrase-resolvase
MGIEHRKSVEEHYTPREVAELLKVSIYTIKRLIRLGKTSCGEAGLSPVIRISGTLMRIPASAVNKLLSARQC